MFDLSLISKLNYYYILYSSTKKSVSDLSEHKQRLLKTRMQDHKSYKVNISYDETLLIIYMYKWFEYFNIEIKIPDECSVW